ncbi:putative membrane protein YkvI [Peribacillus deserti]|uniref:Membrane protein YkvI n=1 Tax=Peribacillus deserti TaxID=673318 RepID=A0ABS2QK61_9BACI|nr:hypothetical protein [Peribacillus deserti]MBM7693149.1 putative membrane protein YkvI [Peribacillus deserti]
MKVRWTGAFQISSVYIGTVVGAGFATGREIVEFFTRYGFFGLLSIIAAGMLFIFTGTKLMLLALKTGAKSYEEFNIYIFGQTFGHLLNILFFVMLLGVTSVMFSGAGAVFQEQLGITKTVGVVLTMGLALLVLLGGIKGLFAVNIFVVPIMIFFSVLMCVLSLKGGGILDVLFITPEMTSFWGPITSPFLYTAFNLALSQAVLVPVASDIGDEKTIKAGAIMGGLFLTLILITSHISLISLPGVTHYEIPTAEVMKHIARNFYWIYILVVYGEIFTSVIGNLFGLERQLKSYVKLPSIWILIMLFIASYILSLIDYGNLLSYLYPLFGKISVLFLFLIWMRAGRANKKTPV